MIDIKQIDYIVDLVIYFPQKKYQFIKITIIKNDKLFETYFKTQQI